MSGDLMWWAVFLGRLGVEVALWVGLAAVVARRVRSAVVERWIWQASVVGVGLMVLAEVGDLRLPLGWVAGVAETESVRSEARAESRVLEGPDAAVVREVPAQASGPAGVEAERARVRKPGTPVGWPAMVWGLGSMVLGGRLVIARWALWRRVRRCRRLDRVPDGGTREGEGIGGIVERVRVSLGVGPVRVLEWPGLSGPVAFGVMRPTVAFPADFLRSFEPVQCEAQIAHELAHLAGRDPLWRLLADAVGALVWWHPGVWWIGRRLGVASERAADAAARVVPGGRRALAEALVRWARVMTTPPLSRACGVLGTGAGAGAGYRSALAGRVVALLAAEEPGRSPGWARGWVGWAGAMGLVVGGVSLPGPGRDTGGMRTVLAAVGPLVVEVPSSPAAPGESGATKDASVVRAVGAGLAAGPALAVGAEGGGAAGAKVDTNRVVELDVKFLAIEERGSEDLGLDWLFGQSPTNNGSMTEALAPTHVQVTGNPEGPNLRTNRMEVAGQWAVLSEVQFRALIGRLEARGGMEVVAAPRVTTYSGQQAQASIQETRQVVTGVATNASEPGQAAVVNYQVQPLPIGPVVDVIPVVDQGRIRLTVIASISEFLGYDDPGPVLVVPTAIHGGGAAPVGATIPLGRVRVLSLTSIGGSGAEEKGKAPGEVVVRSGETVVLRGPLTTDVVRTSSKVPTLGDLPRIGRFFRNASTHTVRKRLYVFVTATLPGEGR